MLRQSFRGVVAYTDDFFIAAATYEECRKWMDILIKLLRKLGFLISWKKVVGPSQRRPLTFLGVNKGKDNLQQLQQQLQHSSARKRASKQQLQSLAGSLNWACQAIQGERFFLWRILDTLQPLQQQRHKARLSADFKQDVQWRLSFLYTFNGTVYSNASECVHVHVAH